MNAKKKKTLFICIAFFAVFNALQALKIIVSPAVSVGNQSVIDLVIDIYLQYSAPITITAIILIARVVFFIKKWKMFTAFRIVPIYC